jgi:alkylation response protein AidB-like acyl-CoA dehydrogenase
MSRVYSKTPQARKLGLKPGDRISLDQAPKEWAFEDPPEGMVHVSPPDRADIVIAFFSAAAELPDRLPELVRRIFPSGALWVAWPRRAGGHESDLTDTAVRTCALELGVVDVKVAAIDADWSGLRFVWRVANR